MIHWVRSRGSAAIKQKHKLSPASKQFVAKPFPLSNSSIHTYMACRKENRVTETRNMGESDGTNLKTVLLL